MTLVAADTSTCALTGDGQLLTWGEAASCSLGYSGSQRQYIPRLVGGALTEHVIVQAGLSEILYIYAPLS